MASSTAVRLARLGAQLSPARAAAADSGSITQFVDKLQKAGFEGGGQTEAELRVQRI